MSFEGEGEGMETGMAAVVVVEGRLVWEKGRGRAGARGGASSMVVSDESLLAVEERDRERERGVEDIEAIPVSSVKFVICSRSDRRREAEGRPG